MIDLNILKNVRKTTYEMLNDRKYKIKYQNLLTEELVKKYEENNCMILCDHQNKKNKMMVIFYEYLSNGKINLESIKKLINKYLPEEDLDITNFILVLNTKMTYRGEREIYDLKKRNIESEIFYFDELFYNIMKHSLQPKFKLLSEKDSDDIKKLYRKNRLPMIKLNDKVNRYFNGKIGDVYKIMRDDSTYYRIVVR